MKNKATQDIKNKKGFFSLSGFITLIIGLLAGFAITYFATYPAKSKHKQERIKETRAGGYKFINPLIECDNYSPSETYNLAKLKKELLDYITEVKADGKISHVSVYYRDLNNGPWIGINEHANYTPASLLKVPLLITVLKKAQKETGFLKSKVTYTGPLDTNFHQNIGYESTLVEGHSYSIDQLLELMIVESDNDAKEMLGSLMSFDSVQKVIGEMGIDLSGKNFSEDFLSVKEYSSFFRILYNASYLDRDMSEKALYLLSRVRFKDGLPARLPKDITISHKFGERGYLDSQMKQLHDCGIVYLPGKPYLLCVMTKGEGFDRLVNVIADISEIVFSNINQNKSD
ncbi:MAG TPA: class A beta-lactamase-related serine hydrolase [Bacteroidales bacterium]|nr:class A beta-lactamase-related serine hydrolase [Bacteroidales bacterium]